MHSSKWKEQTKRRGAIWFVIPVRENSFAGFLQARAGILRIREVIIIWDCILPAWLVRLAVIVIYSKKSGGSIFPFRTQGKDG